MEAKVRLFAHLGHRLQRYSPEIIVFIILVEFFVFIGRHDAHCGVVTDDAVGIEHITPRGVISEFHRVTRFVFTEIRGL